MNTQKDLFDCGAVVLQSLHHYFFDYWIDLGSIKEKLKYGKEGVSIYELSRIGEELGIKLEAYKGDIKNLKSIQNDFPVVCLIKQEDFNHFVIVTKINEKHIHYYDPTIGKIKIKIKNFEEIFLKILLTASKNDFYVKKEIPKDNIESLFSNIFSPSNLLLILLSILFVGISFISTFYFKIVLDNIIPSSSKNELLYISISFILIGIIKVVLNHLKKYVNKKIELNISYIKIEKFYEKLFNADYKELGKNSQLGITKKMSLIYEISSFQSNFISIIFIESISFISSFIFLFSINSSILLLMLLISFFVIGINLIFSKKNRKNYKEILESSNSLYSSDIELVNAIEDIRFNSKDFFIKKYNKNLKNNFEKSYKIFLFSSLSNCFNEIIKIIIPILIIYFSSLSIFENKLTIGEMIMIINLFNFLIIPLESMGNLIISYQLYKENLEAINIIMNIPEEKSGKILIDKIKELKMEDVYFKYNFSNNVFYIRDLKINNHHKIIGKNASGKSTFLKCISLLLEMEGDFKINNIDNKNINRNKYREKIFYASSNSKLPTSTLIEFITNNENKKIDLLNKSLETTRIQQLLNNCNLNLGSKIENQASNISFGQKQIILLLPLLINEYDMILLDEVFENVDEINFNILKEEILKKHREKIIIEISHRGKFITNGKEVTFEKNN